MFKFISNSAKNQGISLISNSLNPVVDQSTDEITPENTDNDDIFKDIASPSSSDNLIDVHVNSDSFNKVILPRIFKSPYIQGLETSLKDQKYKLDLLDTAIINLTGKYTKQLEDLGYEKGTLDKLLDQALKDEIIPAHGDVFCRQIKQIVVQVRTLIDDVDEIKPRMNKIDDLDNQKKQFDYRLAYLESVSKNIVTQTEYRSDTLKFEERLLHKTAKAYDSVFEELGSHKDYLDKQVALFQDKVNGSEMKTICKIQDCEDLLKQRVSEHFLDNLMKSSNERMLKHVERSGDRNLSKFYFS
jgi:hypothetical protein